MRGVKRGAGWEDAGTERSMWMYTEYWMVPNKALLVVSGGPLCWRITGMI